MENADIDTKAINSALNEATIVNLEFNSTTHILDVTISPIIIDEHGTIPADNRLVITFTSVSRLAATYRLGRWDDKDAKVAELTPERLRDNIHEFGQFEIYGREFIDSSEGYFERSESRLSFDHRSPEAASSKHTFEFARDTDNYLEVKVWFDKFYIHDLAGNILDVMEFIAGVKRAWNSRSALDDFGICVPDVNE